MDVVQRVTREMEAVRARLPAGMAARVPYDATDCITNAIREVTKTLGDKFISAFGLAVAVAKSR